MPKIFERHTTGITVSVFVAIILGFIEMRVTVGQIDTTVKESAQQGKETRKEQLLRTDTVGWAKQHRINLETTLIEHTHPGG